MLRVPGSKGLSPAEGQGRRRRHPHGLFDARRGEARRGEPGARGRLLRHRLRDHDAADRAGDRGGRARRASTNFSVFCNHVLTPSAIAAHPRSAGGARARHRAIDGFIGPAHVSIVIGSQPYEFFAEEYRKPVVIAGFEPIDVMQAILMLVRQLNEGRAEVENQFTRAVTRDGNRQGAGGWCREVFELRRDFEWRGPRPGPLLGAAPQGRVRGVRRRAPLRRALYRRSRDNKACECPAILRGVKKPTDCKAVRPRLHAGNADRLLHGVLGRRLRRLLHLRPHAGAGAMNVAAAHDRARSARRLDLAGRAASISRTAAGGRAMAAADRGAVPRRPSTIRSWRAATTRPPSTSPAGRMVMATDCFVVSPLFFPGGDIGSLAVHGTVNDVAMSGARPLYLSAGFVLEEGFPARRSEAHRRLDGARPRARPASPSSPATPRWSSAARPTACSSPPTGIGVVPAGVEISGDRARPGDAILVSGTHGRSRRRHHGAPRRASNSRPTIVSDSAALQRPGRRHGGRGADDPRAARSDPRRPRGDAQRDLPASRASACGSTKPRSRSSPRFSAPASCSASTALNVANEGKLIAIVPADGRRAPARRAARPSARPRRRDDRRSRSPIRHASCSMATGIGGERIVDWLAGEQLPRIC